MYTGVSPAKKHVNRNSKTLPFVVFVGSVVAGIDPAGAGGGPASPS